MLIFNIVTALTLAMVRRMMRDNVDKKLNHLIVDMMIEENSQSDIIKFYVFSSYKFIDVKIDSIEQPGEKTGLILTNMQSIAENRINLKRLAHANSHPNSTAVVKGQSKDSEENRLINSKDKENFNYNNYEC